MQVLAFRHAPLEGTGTIADALTRHGIGCDSADLYLDSGGPPPLTDFAGLIVMGGPMSANDDLPWVRREIAAIRGAITRGMPVLGICLGSQLIARALGSRVYRNTVKEIGWSDVRLTGAGRADPLLGNLQDPQPVFQWHGETFDLPDGAELLAEGSVCRHQAFRHGANIYALQFHLEVTPDIIAEWLRQDEACGDVREATAPIDPHAGFAAMSAGAAAVFDAWCGLLLRNSRGTARSFALR